MNAWLTPQPIDATALVASVSSPHRGALVMFTGLVRDRHAGRAVVSLAYSAYGGMAERVCAEILAEAGRRWAASVALAHRLGELHIGDVAVVVVVAADHREAAFDACRWVIDEVKRRVPIWKRERYADGTGAWVDPTAPGGVVVTPS
ncbi:MAG: molybdenum cofactor biosynthesis protein MoaE [Gemmatimonadales bacterium]